MENGNGNTRKSGEAARRLGHCRRIARLYPHPAYAENATAAVVSDDGSHIVVDVDLNGGASDVGSDRQGAEKGSQGESASDTETDKTMKAFEGLMTFNVIIITTAFYYMFLPFISAMAMILLLNELLDLHDRRRL